MMVDVMTVMKRTRYKTRGRDVDYSIYFIVRGMSSNFRGGMKRLIKRILDSDYLIGMLKNHFA